MIRNFTRDEGFPDQRCIEAPRKNISNSVMAVRLLIIVPCTTPCRCIQLSPPPAAHSGENAPPPVAISISELGISHKHQPSLPSPPKKHKVSCTTNLQQHLSAATSAPQNLTPARLVSRAAVRWPSSLFHFQEHSNPARKFASCTPRSCSNPSLLLIVRYVRIPRTVTILRYKYPDQGKVLLVLYIRALPVLTLLHGRVPCSGPSMTLLLFFGASHGTTWLSVRCRSWTPPQCYR